MAGIWALQMSFIIASALLHMNNRFMLVLKQQFKKNNGASLYVWFKIIPLFYLYQYFLSFLVMFQLLLLNDKILLQTKNQNFTCLTII